MHTNPMIPALKSLKLYGMAHALSDLAEREVRSVAYQLKTAKFPAYRDLSGFDFTSSMANEALIRQLCAGDFMDKAQNVVFVGVLSAFKRLSSYIAAFVSSQRLN